MALLMITLSESHSNQTAPKKIAALCTLMRTTPSQSWRSPMLNIKSWMDAMKLKLNETKTDFIYFGGKHQLAKTGMDTININGKTIQCTNKIKISWRPPWLITYLQGSYNSNVKSSHHKHHKIRNVRKYLNQDTCHKTCHHPNAITPGLFQLTAIRTTRFQHKDTIKSPKQCSKISNWEENANHSSMENTKQLHWLPIKQCINYKVRHTGPLMSATKKHLNTCKTSLMKKCQEDRDCNLKK